MLLQNILTKNNFVNLLILLIPLSYIAGNLVLNINIFVFILFALVAFNLKIFHRKLSKTDILVIILFSYIILNGLLNNFLNFNFSDSPKETIVLIKSLLYLRFLFLYFIIKYLIKEKIINFKYLFFSFCLCALFVASDIIVQFFFDKDIFGFEKLNSSRRLAGPFGDEAIAGSFIQRFFIFIPFLVLFFLNIKKNLKIIFIILSIIICMLGIIFAGNRVPLFLFCILMILFIFYGKFFQKTLLISLICSISFITIIAKKNENFYNHYYGFLSKSNEIIEYATTRFFTDQKIILSNTYIKEFETGILTWEQNKFFGGGIKSFYYNCSNIKNSAMDEFGGTNCNTHPHNYYLEIASELGIIGLILILTVFLTVFLKAVKILHFSKNLILNSKVIIPFFLVFIVEIFPFKTTGSFFTTTNSTFLFIILSFIVGLSELKNLSKNKNE